MSMTAARLHIRITLAFAAALAFGGFAVGTILDGWATGLAAGAAVGLSTAAGSYLTRHRTLDRMEAAQGEAQRQGYTEGLAQGVLASVARYEAAAFPMSPGGVTPEERAARRTVAYQLSAEDALPHQVRKAAAAALEALDSRDLRASQDAFGRLASAVRDVTARH